MKKVLFIALLLITHVGFLLAQDLASIVNQSDNLYKAGEYAKAAELMESIIHLVEKNTLDYAFVMNALGIIYRDMGNYAKPKNTI